MAQSPESCKKLFNIVLEKLVATKHFTSSIANEAKQQFSLFLSTTVKDDKQTFLKFDIDNTKLDVFLLSYLKDDPRFKSFTLIAKFVCTLSHGQSKVERGFSVNKSILVENLQEESIIAQRTVIDYMHANSFELHTLPIERDLIKKVKNSYQEYTQFLANQRKEKALKEKENQMKPILEEISSLDLEKTRLENMIKDLRRESDELGYEAGKAKNFDSKKTTIEKCNLLKRAAEDKQKELSEVIGKRQKLQELKDKK